MTALGQTEGGRATMRFVIALVLVVGTATTVVQDVAARGGTCTIVGTPGGDVLRGTRGRDVICGRGGNDAIFAGGGDDVLRGGRGGDVLNPGRGNDLVAGEDGRDLISYGGDNRPVVVNLTRGRARGVGFDRFHDVEGAVGGPAHDRVVGSVENNLLRAHGGLDFLGARGGDDHLVAGKDCDWLYGGPGNDVLNGGPASDWCRQGAGDGRRIGCP
jgi:Ca2+-binding RTX toxin-like protein